VWFKDKIPYHVLHKKPTDMSILKVFGFLCFVSIHEANITKFDQRAKKCAFLCYKEGTKGYVVFYLKGRPGTGLLLPGA